MIFLSSETRHRLFPLPEMYNIKKELLQLQVAKKKIQSGLNKLIFKREINWHIYLKHPASWLFQA